MSLLLQMLFLVWGGNPATTKKTPRILIER
jgi:hypothetical protein